MNLNFFWYLLLLLMMMILFDDAENYVSFPWKPPHHSWRMMMTTTMTELSNQLSIMDSSPTFVFSFDDLHCTYCKRHHCHVHFQMYIPHKTIPSCDGDVSWQQCSKRFRVPMSVDFPTATETSSNLCSLSYANCECRIIHDSTFDRFKTEYIMVL